MDVIEYLGADTFVLFDCGAAGQINVRVPGEAGLDIGQRAGLSLKISSAVFFGSDNTALR